MYDDELDDLLSAAAPRPRSRADALAQDLATALVHADLGGSEASRVRRRRFRKPFVIGGAAVGVLALSAGMTADSWMMSVPPFMTLEPGKQRVYEPIEFVADWGNGEQRKCQLFLEFRGLDNDEIERVAAYVRAKDWSSWTDDLSDAATDDSRVLSDRFLSELRNVLPDIDAPSASGTGPVMAGYGTSCEGVE